jgi:hypothetical protein
MVGTQCGNAQRHVGVVGRQHAFLDGMARRSSGSACPTLPCMCADTCQLVSALAVWLFGPNCRRRPDQLLASGRRACAA